ncbi:MAG: hypothetical protein FJ088_03325, partial [Deltaproteobacteria bacterium]|nr:hypothetical protein [Deltaproteobacteria bacterium]
MNPFEYLDGYLAGISRNLKKNLLLEVLETFSILFLSLTAISVSICVSLGFAPLVRVVYFSASALLLLSSAAYFLYACRKELGNHIYLAGFLEERINLDYGLKTYVELKDFHRCSKGSFSDALFAANAAQTAKRLADSDPEKVTEHKRAVKLLAVLFAMVLTIVSLAIAFPGGFSQGVKNLFAIKGENFLFFQTPPVKVRNLFYDARIEIYPPSYLESAETNVVTGSMDITIPAGASVKIAGKTGGDVTGGALIFMDDRGIKHYLLENVEDNRPQVRFSPSGKGKYIFRMQKSSGITVEEEQWHSIEIKGDMPPEVDIIPPAKNILKAGEEIKIELSAGDDYGLRAIDIVFSPQGGEASVEERKRIHELAGEKSFSGFVIFRMPEIDPLEGGVCNLWFEAFDSDPSPKKKGKSAVVEFITDTPEIRILKDIESLAEIFDRLVAILDLKLTGKKDGGEGGTETVKLISKAGEVLKDLNRYLPEITGESVFKGP